jgi:Trypsin-co-occurring domain 1
MEWKVLVRTMPAEGESVAGRGVVTTVAIDKALAAVEDLVRQTKPFIASMGDDAPDSVTLSGEIALSLQAGIGIFTASGEGDFGVSLTWNKPGAS